MRLALNALRQVSPAEVRTATSLIRTNGYRPDYYALETASTVAFPWDRHVLNADGEIITNPLYADLV